VTVAASIVLATKNRHKLAELHRILDVAGLDIDLLGSDAFPDLPDIPETESSFAGNALLKAREIARITGLPAVADDSGLCIDALNGMPGILSARWSGRHGDDLANLNLVLGQLSDVPDRRRGGAFHCAAAIALPDGTERVVEGTIEGSIIREPRGSGGFGYDPIFVPLGHTQTLAEIPAQAKDAISHRGRALEALAPVIAALLTPSSGE
jgi:XTP/dITP diphosphohydrolase